MISYRSTPSARTTRWSAPEPPYWAAASISPYSSPRETPLAIDLVELTLRGEQQLAVDVAELESVGGSTEKPLLIDAAGPAELIYRRGEAIAAQMKEEAGQTIFLSSASGALPVNATAATTVIATWPLNIGRLDDLFERASSGAKRWGALVPLVHPLTTTVADLARVADSLRRHKASFLASTPIDVDATAKPFLATGDSYEEMTHAELETIIVATERHVAALAHERQLLDFIPTPDWPQPTNWNCAVALTRAGTRLIRMERDVELGWSFVRQARAITAMEKQLTWIASRSHLGIIDFLDEITVDALTEFISEGRSAYFDEIDVEWRLRRDYIP